jgi:hypothetical protein
MGETVGELRRTLSWSHSRARAFREGCARAYWLTYYGSWGGWADDAPPEVREAWLQKKLTGRAAWIGVIVHDVASRGLVRAMRGEPEDAAAALVFADRTVRVQFARSRDGTWRRQTGRERVGLPEHYYGEPLPDDAEDAAAREVAALVEALHAHPFYRRMLAVPHKIAEQEVLREFLVDRDPVLASLDVLMWDGQGGAVIVDWKTGRHHEGADIAAQLGAYGLYAAQERGVPRDRIRAVHVNLRDGTTTTHAVGEREIEAARARIAEDMAAMRARLRDIPANEAAAEDYPLLPAGSTDCARCNFRGTCGRT